MTDVFLSNGFIPGPVESSVEIIKRSGFNNIELSNGLCEKSSLNYLKRLVKSGTKIRLHNYFPALTTPFVLNLSSNNSEIIKLSKKLIETALEWSFELDSTYYTFHAGYRLSPKIENLNGRLSKQPLINKNDAKKYFLENLEWIQKRAKSLGIEIAVENNVYDSKNYLTYSEENPFLLCGDIESDMLMPDEIGILLDFGHLKVSSKSLNFDKKEAFDRWKNKITGYHISDNDGYLDSNSHIHKNCYFWEFLEKKISYVTLEIYQSNLPKIKEDYDLVDKFFND